MQHCADPNASPEVCRTGGQITPFRAEGELEPLLQLGICRINGIPRLPELKPWPEGLHPKMVLLVDHHAEGFFAIEHQTASGALGCMLAADEMPFDQDLFVE